MIGGYFSPAATTAERERKQIAGAIGQIERYVGPMTKTAYDLPGTFEAPLFDVQRQMDCVDEAKNTTLYLRILREKGWINFHREGYRVNRGFFFNGWPHTSAMINNPSTGKDYVVDSWFHKNGEPVEIVPLKLWHAGWWPKTIIRD
ncbi:MAG: hypothetical protein A6F71_07930 [Cycloclasticus sp. symbiont of Poecilosclerida sp. M]|nr:MAG: hypothetical protein A6F71_07930 [Cycloclasticus sp. symbiont of Poecilosclerida sp. M]